MQMIHLYREVLLFVKEPGNISSLQMKRMLLFMPRYLIDGITTIPSFLSVKLHPFASLYHLIGMNKKIVTLIAPFTPRSRRNTLLSQAGKEIRLFHSHSFTSQLLCSQIYGDRNRLIQSF